MSRQQKPREKHSSLILAHQLKAEEKMDSFFGFVVTGRQKVGKTSYVCQGVAEAYGRARNDYSKHISKT